MPRRSALSVQTSNGGGALVTKLKKMGKPMIESGKITIAYQVKGKPTTLLVDAEIIGLLAVHPTVKEDGFWTLTHVQTGHALYRFFKSNLEAIIVAKKLAAHVGWQGSLDEIKANAKLKTHVSAVLREHGFTVGRDTK